MTATAQSARMEAHIRETFLRMLETKDAESISVSELAKEAGINRSTFYRHYDSIFAVLGDCIAINAGNADKKIPAPDDPAFMEKVRIVLEESFRDIANHPDLYQMSGRYKSKVGVSRHVAILQERANAFYEGLMPGLEVRYPGIAAVKAYVPVMLSRLSGGVTGTWVAGGMKESPEEIAAMEYRAFLGLLEGFSEAPSAF